MRVGSASARQDSGSVGCNPVRDRLHAHPLEDCGLPGAEAVEDLWLFAKVEMKDAQLVYSARTNAAVGGGLPCLQAVTGDKRQQSRAARLMPLIALRRSYRLMGAPKEFCGAILLDLLRFLKTQTCEELRQSAGW